MGNNPDAVKLYNIPIYANFPFIYEHFIIY